MPAPDKASALHDPGGKVRLALQPDVVGDAEFSPCGRYRYWLSRIWAGGGPLLGGPNPDTGGCLKALLARLSGIRTAAFIAMNPSTADGSGFDDPTVRREITYARSWGYEALVKLNMLDWRATSPSDLPVATDRARSSRNLPTILEVCRSADLVVLACGVLPKAHQGVFTETVDTLRSAGIALHHLRKTATGFPAHPLYLPKTLRPLPWV